MSSEHPSPAPGPLTALHTVSFQLTPEEAQMLLGPAPFRLERATRAATALSWSRNGRGFAGLGRLGVLQASGPERFEQLREQFTALASDQGEIAVLEASGRTSRHPQPFPGLGAFAFARITYSKRSQVPSELIIPRLVLAFPDADFLTSSNMVGALFSIRELGTPWLTVLSRDTSELPGPSTAGESGIRWRAEVLEEAKALVQEREADRAPSPQDALLPGSLDPSAWTAAVQRGLDCIAAGEVTKIVMARDVVVRSEEPISGGQLAGDLAEAYPSCWTYRVGSLIGATPEMLIRLLNGQAQARVLAGTIDRKAHPEWDREAAGARFLSSPKEIHEHQLAIDSLVARLEAFAPQLAHDSDPFVLELPNVWHLASDVSVRVPTAGPRAEAGQAPGGSQGRRAGILDLTQRVHPTAAVCGTPREVASLLISELEHMERSWYAGPVGWLDAAGNGEMGIALRGMVIEEPHRARVYGGCGIVAGSDPEMELKETWAKMRPVLSAFGLEQAPQGSPA